jgi:membrane protease YdiL (CAAX protease family)
MDNDDFSPPQNFVLLAAVFEGGLAVVAVGLGWLLGQNPLESFPRTPADAAWGAACGAAAALPPVALLWLCLKCPVGPLAQLTQVVDELLVPLFRDCRLMDLAVISALAGLGEEMLFRGVIQQAVTDWLGGETATGTWVGLAVAALLFGLVHMITPTYALLAGGIGLYLGWVWIRADRNLLVPIVIHAVYDLLALIYLVRIRRRGRAAGGRGKS